MLSDTTSPYQLDKRKTRSGFERAASTYDANAVLQREIGGRLTERLDLVRMQPETVLDLGCGTGFVTEHLLRRYKQARVVGVDLSLGMAQKIRKRGGWFRKPQAVCADAAHLPFRPQSADMLVSNLMLQWCNDLPAVFRECVQVLKPDGLLMFSTFGPDTLKELRASWGQVDGFTHTSRFVDMHDVGDALLQAGFRDPVMDMEMVTLTYADVRGLLRDLKGIGANNATSGRNHGLTGKARLQAFLQAYESFRLADGHYPATYEVVYGHAWAPKLAPSKLPDRFIPIMRAKP
ncbi:malonyl-ACP O-methyltransferase BioC [Candidatus Thiothrix sp. Deng01]|uniref:Malonyl-[acyl-carrier protein] O-methyltransferase n=1 Tax=Candidatus Thiothrix phosphatis TaxID=3112415 RepID=A0ABU6D215_9GAMM|nr:malonyl-ACP O-methyltransferase BioC [Candidatus Thiothrix sp. Deng01]MEB4592733.1 malonyl-ACP O-methyltransferase BioC [Candidatus Thiothrix sp. Deng01]